MKKQQIRLNDKTLGMILSVISQSDLDGTIEVIVRDYKLNRKLVMNGLYWVWLTYLETQTGHTKEFMHLRFRSTFMLRIYMKEQKNENQEDWIALWLVISELGDMKAKEKALKTLSTTWADTDQFHEYLKDIEQFCMDKGWQLPADPKYKEAFEHGS